MTKEDMLIEVEDRLERCLWRVEGWIDRRPRLSRWYIDWLLPRMMGQREYGSSTKEQSVASQ